MKRHRDNTNLRLINNNTYRGYQLLNGHGALIADYLDKVIDTVSLAVGQHSKVFAFRLDLHLPRWLKQNNSLSNEYIRRFIAKFGAIIQADLKGGKHSSKLRYVWVREFGEHQNSHYHLAILLNGHAYSTVGNFNMRNRNLFTRIVDAWAWALDAKPEEIMSCVHIPANAEYRLSRSSIENITAFIQRVSYICKVNTKQYGYLSHNVSSSRS